jgi:hypothetical protein
MAALLSSGTVEYAHYWCSSTAKLFLGFVSDLAQKVSKPLAIVLDNASIHRAGAIQDALQILKQQGGSNLDLRGHWCTQSRMCSSTSVVNSRWTSDFKNVTD